MNRSEPQHQSDPDLEGAVARLARASVLVVGDVMLDRYVYGRVSRISPEAPVPVLSVDREVTVAGGAGHVVRNLTALRAAVAFVAVVGDDQPGSDLTGLIGGQPNVEPWLLVQGGRRTTVKGRFVAKQQQLFRVDHEETGPVHPKLAERMVRIVGDALAATSATVLADYGKGVLAKDIPAQIIEAARQAARPVLVDPSGSDYTRYAGADVMVLGTTELREATGLAGLDDATIARAGLKFQQLHGFDAIVVCREAAGLTVIKAGAVEHFPSFAAEVSDAAGARDAVLATLAAALAAGLGLRVGARLAAIASDAVIGQPSMILARGIDLLNALSTEGQAMGKIVTREMAAAQVERWRGLGWRTGFAGGKLDARLAADRAVLEHARGACDRLVIGLDGAAGRHRPAERPAKPTSAAAALASLPTVDLICLYDEEDGPEATIRMLRPDLVVQEGLAPEITPELVRSWGGKLLIRE